MDDDAGAVAFLEQHGIATATATAILLASGGESLDDLLSLDEQGCAEVSRGARLTPVASSRLRRALGLAPPTLRPPCAAPTADAPLSAPPPLPTAQQLNAQLAKGGVVQLPAGVITIDRPLLLGTSNTILQGVGAGITVLRLKKPGEAIQMLSLLFGRVAADGTVTRTSGLVVRGLTVDGGQSGSVSNPVVGIGQGPSALDMNCAMGAPSLPTPACTACGCLILSGELQQCALMEGSQAVALPCCRDIRQRRGGSGRYLRQLLRRHHHGRPAPGHARRCHH